MRQVRERLLAGQVRRVGVAGDDVREQLHALADRGQLRERAKEEPPFGSWFQPSTRIARDRVDIRLSGAT